MTFFKKSMIAILSLFPALLMAEEHNHNHFNPALEALGSDIISLTVCYNNGYLSDQDQEPAFKNLIAHAGVDGEELGMYYMNSLGAKAEEIMADEQGKALWDKAYCDELTLTYLDVEKLKEQKGYNDSHHGHQHDHQPHGHGVLSADIVQQDIERGKLLYIN